ncbi:MAG: YeeE/YedE thiosulfate transporter family protein [bacterium]
MSDSPRAHQPAPYADPYRTGALLGLVLLASFALAGRGLGASGAFASAAASSASVAAPAATARNDFFTEHLGGGLLHDWLVVEVIGVVIGGLISAALAGRIALRVEHGPRIGVTGRLASAATGGLVMGAGAVLARGCTSGQALTGGAMLSVGSWLFVIGAFGAAYVVAYLTRRSWT